MPNRGTVPPDFEMMLQNTNRIPSSGPFDPATHIERLREVLAQVIGKPATLAGLPGISGPLRFRQMMVPAGKRLCIIKPGFGGGQDGAKFKYLEANGFDCHLIDLPEPTDGDEAIWAVAGIELITQRLRELDPDVLVACSRGGKYAGEVIQQGIWKGPTFLISALRTNVCCVSGVPVLCCHGINDHTNTIERVRGDVAASATATLVQFDDNHSLHKLVDEGRFAGLLRQCYDLQFESKPVAAASPARPPPMGGMFAELKAKTSKPAAEKQARPPPMGGMLAELKAKARANGA
jgi:hypothetical protein